MIDTHCHLADKQFARDLPQVIARAREQGIDRMITIADSVAESRACLAIAQKYPELFCTVGVHPHHAKDWQPADADTLRTMASSEPRVRAIGEIGLDYHYNFSPRETQRPVFRAQLALAQELKLPAVVHCREAIADVRADLKEMDLTRIVLHCCTEAWRDVEDLVARGLRLSFTGIATYPQAEEIRHVIQQCPTSQIMVETDAPYLAPVPYRGKRNEPAFVLEVAKLLAQLKNLPPEDVDRITSHNAVEFFGLPS
ncbi:MAG: TatD family hydrolase [Candidatus Peribacter sp.]|nr:TatD family hydrolase [Candidatus Peribacter sp.]